MTDEQIDKLRFGDYVLVNGERTMWNDFYRCATPDDHIEVEPMPFPWREEILESWGFGPCDDNPWEAIYKHDTNLSIEINTSHITVGAKGNQYILRYYRGDSYGDYDEWRFRWMHEFQLLTDLLGITIKREEDEA